MEFEDREFKHVCKFCNKRFPCGQSLGGHIRSHLINNSAETEEEKFMSRVKLTSASNVDFDFNTEPHQQPGYGLRENPKRTWRIADSSEDTSVHDKLCRECGKVFQSWKALFGHMKCHSEKERGVNSVNTYSFEEEFEEGEDEDSWTCENETTNTNTATNRGRRSTRRRTRYMGTITTTSSNFSIGNAAAAATTTTSSVYEIEQELEEVAMCLMMLSRDVGGHWGGLKFVAESSDNNSVFSEGPSSGRTSPVKPDFEGKMKKKLNEKRQHPESNLVKKTDQLAQLGTNNKYKSSNVLDSEAIYKNSQKRSKFECTTCNKVFKSYQALGGHRASHKKIKGCFASKIESSENTIETSGSKIIEHEVVVAVSNCEVKAEISGKSKGHCCPICQKVFPSGQALGGHKRSHLIGGSAETNNTSQTPVVDDQKPEVRDFLDLNLPAPVEEESSSSHAAVAAEFRPWWVGSSHKHETLVGLISN